MSDHRQTDEPLGFHDDNRVMNYLLKNVKGISNVSGGVLGDALENEYAAAEAEARGVSREFDPESDVV